MPRKWKKGTKPFAPVQTSSPDLIGDSNPSTLPGFESIRHPLAVIAGTHEQFVAYCQQRHLIEGDAVYITNPSDAEGKRFRGVVTTGSYYRLDNWQELFSRCSLK